MGEMKQHPWTTSTAGIALAGVAFLALPGYVKAGDIAQQVARIETVQKSQIRETLQNRLGNLKSSLFDVQSKIDEFRSKGLPVDELYIAELKRLTNEIDDVKAKVAEAY